MGPVPGEYVLDASRRYCHALTRRAAANFYPAFLVLPRDRRRGMEALYAFFRLTDDIADEPGDPAVKARTLADWRAALTAALAGQPSHPLHPALAEAVRRFHIPPAYLYLVIDGVAGDIGPVAVRTFPDLYEYCYRVASAVGLACIHVWGFRGEMAKKHAEAAGVAFQLTNILRDLGEDRAAGRVYLPAEETARFHCPPEAWRADCPAFRSLMRFQVRRARAYYDHGEGLDAHLTPEGRAVFGALSGTYRSLLNEIEARNYDVFGGRVRLPRRRKAALLLRAFPVRWGWR